MSEVHSLAAEKRERAGKGAARAARRAGHVPAVIYGNKQSPVTVNLDGKQVRREIHQPGFFTKLYDITVDGKKQRVLPRDIQLHPVTDQPLHIDFLRVSAATTVTVEIPVLFVNDETCPGLVAGGVLNVVRHAIEMECRADGIPPHIEVDLSKAEVGDSLHISEVALPDSVTPTITDRDFTIATIAAPSALKSEAEEAEEGEEGEEEEAAEEVGEEG